MIILKEGRRRGYHGHGAGIGLPPLLAGHHDFTPFDAAGIAGHGIDRGGRLFTIFMVSKLTVMTVGAFAVPGTESQERLAGV
jgi:hypothetical protein